LARDAIFDQVQTPQSLDNYVRGVQRGHYTSLIIIGRGGTGKSSMVRRHFPENDEDNPPVNRDKGAFWRKGKVSPVQFYAHLHRWRDRTIVLDDAPDLARNLPLAGLMRQLCETEDVRRISWDTQNSKFAELGIPSSFQTQSRFILISNKWMSRHEEVEALETRVPIVLYDPAVQLIHEQAIIAMESGVKDVMGNLRFEPKVVNYIGKAIKEERVHALNLRDYILNSRRMRNGDDWKAVIEQQILPDVIENVPNDVDFILGWMRRAHRTRTSPADVYRNTKRFRGDMPGLERTFRWMSEQGVLVRVQPRPNRGPGRPGSQEYVLPPYKIVSPKVEITSRSKPRAREHAV
jgi:hypothetical protein